MKWIKYQIVCGKNENEENILVNKKVGYSTENLAIAEKEAHDGYEIVDDEQSFDKEPLGIEFGGTDAKTAKGAEFNISGGISEITDKIVDEHPLVFARTSPTATSGVFYKRKASKLWDYIAGKIRNTFGFNSDNVLPVANGGTGNTTGLAASATKLATARTIVTNLGSMSPISFNGTENVAPGVTGVLSIVNGGTQASTPEEARKKLGVAAVDHTHSAKDVGAVAMTTARFYLQVADWDSNLQQTVNVAGVTADCNVIVSPSAGTYEAYHGSMVRCSAQADGTLTFTASEKPSIRLFVYALILKS